MIYNLFLIDEEKTKDKLSDDDKETLEDIVKKTTEWIEENGTSGQLQFLFAFPVLWLFWVLRLFSAFLA